MGRLSGDLGVVRGEGTVRCPALPAGVYFVRLRSGSNQLETKLVLTR
jgi:hypothetical protein